MNFLSLINDYSRNMPLGSPCLAVAHPEYGTLGTCSFRKGFVPVKRRWSSVKAILKDSDREEIKILRSMEDNSSGKIQRILKGLIRKDPRVRSFLVGKFQELGHSLLGSETGAISTYDSIVSARGSGALQDIWMVLTTAVGGVTLVWYDTWQGTWSIGVAPTPTTFTDAGTGGAVLDSVSNGSWLTNPGGTNKKYVVSCGLTISSIIGFSLALLVDNLWNGEFIYTSNVTLTPTASVPTTRYATTASAGNMLMGTMVTAYTRTVAPTITVGYTDQAGVGSKSTTAILGAAIAASTSRVLMNNIHNSATVVASTPFMPFTNSGSYGIRAVDNIVISGGTVTVGTMSLKIVRPLILMPFIAAASFIEQDTTLNIGNMIELTNVTQVCGCLSWVLFSGGTTTATMGALLRTVEG